MESVIAIMDEALPCPVRARGADKGAECAVYNFNTTVYNGARREARMKVQLYAKSMLRGLELEKQLDEALVTVSERPLTATVTRCERNGGGWLEDGDWHVRIAYYDLTMRG